jgi:predicted Fe-Mo cluster-binding NifX family protein
MGARALAFFQEHGIQTATGASGTVRVALEHYLAGTIQETMPCSESVGHRHCDEAHASESHAE